VTVVPFFDSLREHNALIRTGMSAQVPRASYRTVRRGVLCDAPGILRQES